VRPQLNGTEQHIAFAAVDRTVSDYLAADEGTSRDDISARHAAAFAAVDALLAKELVDVQEKTATVHTLDDLADLIGFIVAGTVTVSAGLLVLWLNTRALRPLFGLAGTMRRFGRGDIEARATPEGPAELAEMAHRFNEMASSIGRQRKDRQAFIAGIVHDLRTPLSVLRMSSDVATGGSNLTPERLARVLATVARQVTRLERMADDLLDSVTIEAGKVTLRTADVDAREVVTDLVEQYRATSSSRHTIDLAVPDAPVWLSCDRMRIEQVLANLLSNAIKYSPEGGLIRFHLVERGGDVVFTVHDEGVGMNETDAAMAFEPFRRSDVLRSQVPGSGLGLFIVRRLVEAHGGRIDLRTSPGEGSTFEVRIPASAGARVELRGADDEEPHRVLHVPHEEEARAGAPDTPARGGPGRQRHQ